MVLRIPDAGLSLESSPKSRAALPAQAFAITLSDNVIEDMIECVRNGQDIQLSLGDIPVSFLGFLLCVVLADPSRLLCRRQ
jgi:RNA polymerase II elongation factor ELL